MTDADVISAIAASIGGAVGPPAAAAALAPLPGTLDAPAAIQRLQARYASLSLLASKISKVREPPCDIIDAYNRAVQNYKRVGQDVFNQLGAAGLAVEQIVYKDGQPEPDPLRPDHVKTIRRAAPLPLPVFVKLPRCPGMTALSGSEIFGSPIALGGVPVAVAAATAIVTVVGRYVIVGVLGVLSYLALREIRVMWRGEDTTPDEKVDAFARCLDTQMKKPGISADSAASRCERVIAPRQLEWSTIAIFFGAVAIAGGVTYLLIRSGSGGSYPEWGCSC